MGLRAAVNGGRAGIFRLASFFLLFLLLAVDAPAEGQPQRIVSLAPSTTEILFAVGAGPSVVGVSRFCNYPEQAADLPRVGGLADFSFEAVLALRPDLVVMVKGQERAREALSRLGPSTVSVAHESISDILHSIEEIGAAAGRVGEARTLSAGISSELERIKKSNKGRPSFRVLVVVDRVYSSSGPKRMHVAGRETLYDEVIAVAGGTNAYPKQSGPLYPALTIEGVLSLKPEVIIELIEPEDGRSRRAHDLENMWREVEGVPAVDQNRVHILSEDYMVRPGPRLPLMAGAFAEILRSAQR